MKISSGLNRVRFPDPVPVGSAIRTEAELTSVSPSSLGHRMLARVTIEVRDEDESACSADSMTLLIGAPGHESGGGAHG
jgi:acyl dehydratase